MKSSSVLAGLHGAFDLVQNILCSLDAQKFGQLIAGGAPELSNQQATAATNVVSGIIRRARTDIGNNLGDLHAGRQVAPWWDAQVDRAAPAIRGGRNPGTHGQGQTGAVAKTLTRRFPSVCGHSQIHPDDLREPVQ